MFTSQFYFTRLLTGRKKNVSLVPVITAKSMPKGNFLILKGFW